jgi:acetylornithine deacetylase/succinyl-diaminopimelate desuccinylase-like protein
MRRERFWMAMVVACAGAAAVAVPALVGARGTARLTDDEILSRLRDYLRIDTSNPPGNEMKAAIFFRDWFQTEGIASTLYEFEPGRAILVARLPGSGGKRPMILSNHMDVVNVERPYWSVDPFGGIVKDGFIYGRGALDMKTTGMLEAVTLIDVKRSGDRLARDLIFVGTADEEVGAAGVEWLVAKHPELVRDAEFMLNEGGVIDAAGGVAKAYSVDVTEKCPFWLKITAKGRPGHGSVPFTENNAVLMLLRALDRLSKWETPIKVTDTTAAYFKARAANEEPDVAAAWRDIRHSIQDPAVRRKVLSDPMLNAILRNTISITMLQGAPQTNIIPTVAEARVDVRLLPGEDPAEFLAEIKRIVEEPGVTIEPAGTYLAATESPVDSEFMRAVDRARAKHHPKAVLAPTMLTGWTESAVLRPLGVKAYGFEPYVLDEEEQNRQHGNDERISIENVLNGARIMEEIVRDVAR